ncbi:MAG: SdpI family protein [Oscillospiraceae bacterium]|nr:SdpI family protein [Oscillospiraceae bacterium]
MNYNVLYLLGELPAPIIILVLSALVWKDPPRQSENIGYRTRRSQSSEQAWLFAQVVYGRLSTIVFAVFTALTAIVGVVGILMNFGEKTGFAVFIAQNCVLVILLFATVAAVEGRLKAAFDENGDPKGR